MAFQINTSKWSPSDALRQRVMGAMEREAQYRMAESKAREAARREVVTTGAMSDYQSAATAPDATRESVYNAAQTAFGRILGVDPKGAKEFAAMSAQYPKYFPTDLNTSELEAYLNANKGRNPQEVMVEWDAIQTARKQATMLRAGTIDTRKGPNGETIITSTPTIQTPRGPVAAAPIIKTVSPQSESSSGEKQRKQAIADAIQAAANIRTLVTNAGGYGPLQEAAVAWRKALQADPEIEKKVDKDKTQITASDFLNLGAALKSTSEAQRYQEMLKRGREYVNATSNYFGKQAIVKNQYGVFVDPNTLDVNPYDGKKRPPLGMHEKHWMQDAYDWTKASDEELMQYSDPDNPDTYIPAAAQAFIDKHGKKK